MTQPALIALVAFGALALVLLVWLVVAFNRFVRLRQHIAESWSDIDVELKRRHELVPNLVETVKGYAAHERELFERVVHLRSQAMAPHASAALAAADEGELARALGRLIAVGEVYPALKADANFLALQKELAVTEDRLAAARRFYNGNVREMNQLCGTIPTNLVASIFGFVPGTFFEAAPTERAAPGIAFSGR